MDENQVLELVEFYEDMIISIHAPAEGATQNIFHFCL